MTEFRDTTEARRICLTARIDPDSGGLVDAGRVLDALDHAHPPPAELATEPAGPDGEEDGRLWWMVGAEMDVELDNTAPGRARFMIGGVEVDLRTAAALRDALSAAITEATR